MSELDDYTRRSGFRPVPAVRRLIAKVRAEASTRSNRGELGAWGFTFARLATMTEAELKERGCPDHQIEPLLRFAMKKAFSIVNPLSIVQTDQEAMRQISEFIVRFARLKWGTEAAENAYVELLNSAHSRRDRLYGYGLPVQERHQ